MLEKSYKK